jgi:DNA-binding MarR family transcriptional regulator
VARRPHPGDGRASSLELTDQGQRAAKQVRAVEDRFHEALAAGVTSHRDIEATIRTLRGIAQAGASVAALDRRLREL